MILEKSHLLTDLRASYGQMDIDKERNWKKIRFRHWKLFRGGHYSRNPRMVQRQFGLRWLTTGFRIRDVLIFTAYTMHGSLDNVSDRIRISTDTRYQLASEPVDERWVGEHPIAHSQANENRLSKDHDRRDWQHGCRYVLLLSLRGVLVAPPRFVANCSCCRGRRRDGSWTACSFVRAGFRTNRLPLRGRRRSGLKPHAAPEKA